MQTSCAARQASYPSAVSTATAPQQGSGAHMLVAGVKAPILGVSLEHTMLDLSVVPHATIGQDVVVLGLDGHQRITLDDLARWQGVGVNDVLMSLNGRVPQVVVESGSVARGA